MTAQDHAPIADAAAFSALYEHAHQTVFRYIYGLHGGPRRDVEDLTAETFQRAWKARWRFEGDRPAAVGWLLTIARRLVIDSYRRQKVRGNIAALDEIVLTDPRAGPEDQAILREQGEKLLMALAALPIDKREMIVLRYVMGWQVKEIGAHLDMLENTVSVSLRRTLETIQKIWSDTDE